MQSKLIFSAFGFVLLLGACDDTDINVEADLNISRANNSSGFSANFNPGDGIIPFPSNLLFSGSVDGTLNIPVVDDADFSDPKVALNGLDGFSTIAPISTTFNAAIESASLTANSVRVFEVSAHVPTMAVTGIIRELQFGVEFIATLASTDPENKTLVIVPLAPLKATTHYMVALTTEIQSTDGRSVEPSAIYKIVRSANPLIDSEGNSLVAILEDDDDSTANEKAAGLEGLRQLTNAQEAVLAGAGLHRDLIVLSWSFGTQSIGNVLTQTRANATGTSAINPTSIGDTTTFLGLPQSAVDIYAGTLTVPYYLTSAISAFDTAPLNNFWQGVSGSNLTRYNPSPIKTGDATIPLLVSVPKGASGPLPVVIYQHGITSNRTTMFAIADAMASIGFAVVAIDLPLHGLMPIDLPLYTGIERTFDLDLIDNAIRAPGPDGTTDNSGTHYINLSNLLVTRDNNRQAVADLFALTNALTRMDYNGDTTPDFDTNEIYFLGHSLGAMVGIPFLALESGVKDAVLGMPGGGIAKLLDGSAQFGPIIAAGLATKGVEKGSAKYEEFMGAAQTALDSADPNNYATAAAAGRGILLFEVIGNGDSELPDQVIPNNVMAAAPSGTVPAPLSGTDPLIALLGLSQISSSLPDADNDRLNAVRFTAGDHASLLSPVANATTTTVMQTAAATFFRDRGEAITLSDTSVVE